MDYITGPVVSVNFHDTETGYSILRVKPSKGEQDYVSVKGYFFDAENSLGRFVKASGKMDQDGDFKADIIYAPKLETISPHIPDLFDGKSYPALSSWTAKALKDAYGEEWIKKLLRENPDAVFGGTSLAPAMKDRAARSWKSVAIRLRPYAILRNLSFTHRQAMNTVETLGSKADHKFFRRPYLLKMVAGVAFDKADQIAQQLGMQADSRQRKQQHIINAFERMESQGNTFIDLNRVTHGLSRYMEINTGDIEAVVRDHGVLDYRMYRLPEIGQFAAKASTIARVKEITDLIEGLIAPDGAKERFQFPKLVSPFPLDPLQVDAIKNSCNSKLSIITGGPGTGKTTIIKEVVHALRHNNRDERIAYCALAGKAARRLSESTGEPAQTINSLLGMKPGAAPTYNADNPLEVDTVIVDELSMVDEELFLALLRAIPKGARLILAGDIDQLPSIRAGAVMADLIGSRVIPSTKLTKSNRFGADSDIGIVARAVNENRVPDFDSLKNGDCQFRQQKSIDRIASQVVHEVNHLIQSGMNPNDIQVLTPQVGSLAGTEKLNRLLKPLMNPNVKGYGMTVFGTAFHPGDRVMQSGSNDYELGVMNGDIGYIESIDYKPGDDGEKSIYVNFDDERGSVRIPFGKMGNIKHAFAMTLHKSQGSEYGAVVIPMCSEHAFMLDKTAIYTGITRAKQKAILVGEKSVLAKAVKQSTKKQRSTLLAHALKRRLAPAKKLEQKREAEQPLSMTS